MTEVDIVLEPNQPPVTVAVPANSPEEAFRVLFEVGNGAGGAGVRHFYYGSVLEPIRNGYKSQLERVEAEIFRRRSALGPKPTAYELRGLAQWAARQRALTARVWRLPTPSLLLGLEARDWGEYGRGGRTFDNLLRRKAVKQGLTGPAAYESILGSASKSNAAVNASVAKGARYLRGGGAVLGAAGLAYSAYEVWDAPPDQRVSVATRAGVGFAGGLIGAEVGVALLAVGAGLLACTPPGWVVIGVGLIAGVVGGYVADRVFFPQDEEIVTKQMNSGIAINPYMPPNLFLPSPGIAPTLLPVIRSVSVTIKTNDTFESLARRAYTQAGLSVGLDLMTATAFANRATGISGLTWLSGDPSPNTSSSMSRADIKKMGGTQTKFTLLESDRAELALLAGRP